MRAKIHRGSQEIGGSCIEVESFQGGRLVLDLGLPLESDPDQVENLLPDIPALYDEDGGDIQGLIISHPHPDHFGLAGYVSERVPIAIGEDAQRIMAVSSKFAPVGIDLPADIHLQDREPVALGPFTVTPFLVDHSAFDAYSFLIEADGERLFYSGDIRGHGRKAALFERLCNQPPNGVDTLLMEGSAVGRLSAEQEFPTEADLEERFAEVIRETSGLAMVYASAQNIDRMVTLFRAAKKTGRQLIIDLYTAEILKATNHASIPQSDWPEVRLFTPYRQQRYIKKNQLFSELAEHKNNRLFPESLPEVASKSVLLFRPLMSEDLERAGALEGAQMIWSLWEGYLGFERNRSFLDWVEEKGLPFHRIHTSGHASIPDLQRLAKALDPQKLVPIHTFEPEQFANLFDQVAMEKDSAWWEVGS